MGQASPRYWRRCPVCVSGTHLDLMLILTFWFPDLCDGDDVELNNCQVYRRCVNNSNLAPLGLNNFHKHYYVATVDSRGTSQGENDSEYFQNWHGVSWIGKMSHFLTASSQF